MQNYSMFQNSYRDMKCQFFGGDPYDFSMNKWRVKSIILLLIVNKEKTMAGNEILRIHRRTGMCSNSWLVTDIQRFCKKKESFQRKRWLFYKMTVISGKGKETKLGDTPQNWDSPLLNRRVFRYSWWECMMILTRNIDENPTKSVKTKDYLY